MIAAADAHFFQATHTRIVAHVRRAPSCSALVHTFRAEDRRAAFTNLEAVVAIPATSYSHGNFRAYAQFSLANLVVTLPSRLVWPHMSAADRHAADTVVAALAHHEAGHVRLAEADVARLNAQPPIVAPTVAAFRSLARARGDAGIALIRKDQVHYDAVTDHGRHQDRLAPPYGGVRTVLRCPS